MPNRSKRVGLKQAAAAVAILWPDLVLVAGVALLYRGGNAILDGAGEATAGAVLIALAVLKGRGIKQE